MSDKERTDRLDDAIIAEALGMDREELAGLVSETETEAARADLQRAMAAAGKLRLARAKSEVALHRAGDRKGASARHVGTKISALRVRDRTLDQKLTMAARSGTAGAEADAASLEDDLSELDAWEAEERGAT
jgi:hypothetical protein